MFSITSRKTLIFLIKKITGKEAERNQGIIARARELCKCKRQGANGSEKALYCKDLQTYMDHKYMFGGIKNDWVEFRAFWDFRAH